MTINYKQWCLILLAGLLVSGTFNLVACKKSEQDSAGGLVTEQQRRSLPARMAKLLFMAQDAFKRRDYRAAMALSDSVSMFDPELTDVHFLRGRIYTNLRSLDKAQEEYQKVLSLDPNYPGVRYNMGNNYLRQGKNRLALKMYEQEQKHFPASNNYLQMGRAYKNLGNAESARWAFEQAITSDNSNASAYMWLAQFYGEEGAFEKALDYSQRGLALEPDNLQYQYLVGSEYFRNNMPRKAIQYLEPVIREKPWHFGANYNMGRALVSLGQTERGKEYLAAADSLQKLDNQIKELRSVAQM